MPKPQNYNHPVCKAIINESQMLWLWYYFYYLNCEYEYRFNKRHAYYNLTFNYKLPISNTHVSDIPIEDLVFYPVFTNFTSVSSDFVSSYREYYKYKKTMVKSFIYTKREMSYWL